MGKKPKLISKIQLKSKLNEWSRVFTLLHLPKRNDPAEEKTVAGKKGRQMVPSETYDETSGLDKTTIMEISALAEKMSTQQQALVALNKHLSKKAENLNNSVAEFKINVNKRILDYYRKPTD